MGCASRPGLKSPGMLEDVGQHRATLPREHRRRIMKHKLVRIALVVLEAFVALSAVAGGIALLTGTFAQGIPVAWLQGTPFSDYTIPGLVLAIVVGGGMGVAAVTVFTQRGWAVLIWVVGGIVLIVS